MTEPEPTYSVLGEQLDSITRDILRRQFEAMRGDGISIVMTAERALRDLGIHVSPAVRGRSERRQHIMEKTMKPSSPWQKRR